MNSVGASSRTTYSFGTRSPFRWATSWAAYADTKADFWFRSPTGRLSFDRWVADVGEADTKARQIQYLDPHRTVATYRKGLGRTGTFDAFIEQARKQSSQNWRQEYTAPAIIAYIQQGFTPAG
ncbi:MAG: hypothetical protein HQ559_18280 [Lentisphaerae bacterium]|nr:hypothetical protein [Lentisphaerota bacterium]